MNAPKRMLDVTAGVLRRDGRVLVARRHDGGAFSRKWEFPGGKVEPGETREAALARELREELSIDVEVGRLIGVVEQAFDGGTIHLAAFEVVQTRGEIRLREHLAMRWATIDELRVLDLAPADARLIEKLEAGGS